jgi:hypothetical protein
MGAESMLGAAGGATPWGAIAQAGIGTIQGVLGMIQAKKAQKQLEKLQSPTYKQSAGILDYYNKALSKYSVNPYQSDYYNQATQQANRGVASGLSALSGRGQALAGVNSLIQGKNDAMLKAGVNAEQMQRQDLSQLGQAAQLKAGEEQTAFQQNEMLPYQNKFNLLARKASGGNQIANSGLSNVFGGLQGIGDANMVNKMYGSSSGGMGTQGASYDAGVYNSLLRNQGYRVR